MATYNWQQDDWPNFRYSLNKLEDKLFTFAERVGLITGKWEALPEGTQQEAVINMMVAEAVKTSEIEGEYLSRKDVLSSIRRNLGLYDDTDHIKDHRAAGVADLMIDVRKTYQKELTKEKLFDWHKMLLGESDRMVIGGWRTHPEAMQVVSGALGKETVHYEAPPSDRVPYEMERFINWFNETAPAGEKQIKRAPIRSAIAHLYFETIHPFEDGNGRIGRAIAEKALSQGIGRPALISLSDAIETNKNEYYEALKKGQRSNEVTTWLHYFLHTVLNAQKSADEMIDFTLRKVKFFDRYDGMLNNRQQKVIRRMLEEGPDGFEGGMSTRKYVNITKTSKATATRDLQKLMDMGALKRLGEAGGRSTRYQVNI